MQRLLAFPFILLSISLVLGQATLTAPSQPFTGSALSFQLSQLSGTASYKLREIAQSGFSTVAANGQVTGAGGATTIQITPPHPGFYRCEVTMPNGQVLTATSSFNPFSVAPAGQAPSNWLSFWQTQKGLLNGTAPDVQLQYLNEDSYTTTYTINALVLNGQRVYGYMVVPKKAGTLPALIQLPPYGNSPNIVVPNVHLATRTGCIVISLNIHNNPPTQAGPTAYLQNGLHDPAAYYLRHPLLGVVRMINYLFTRSDFNGQVGVFGDSQGGGLAQLAAAIDDRISVLITCYSALGNQQGGTNNRPTGFPHYYDMALMHNLNVSQTLQTAAYYDPAFAARHFEGTSYHVVGYLDEVSPPVTVMSQIMPARGRHIVLHQTNSTHNQYPAEFASTDAPLGFNSLLRRIWPGTQSPPWPWPQTTKGLWIDAGKDTSISLNIPLQLSAIVQLENSNLNTAVSWQIVEGPQGAAITTAANGTTAFQASQTGTYFVRAIATYTVNNQQVFSLHDHIKITVGGSSQSCPNGLTIGAPCNDNNPQTTNDVVNANCVCVGTPVSNPNTLVLSPLANQTIQLQPGQSQTQLVLTQPTATTGCNQWSVPAGYTDLGVFNNRRYLLSNQQTTWWSAHNQAIALGGRLAQIPNSNVQNYLRSKIGSHDAFIGLSDWHVEGQFKWTNGQSATFFQWQAGQPDNSGDQDYVIMRGTQQGRWHDMGINHEARFIVDLLASNNAAPPPVTQTGGPTSGSFVSAGTYTIVWQATDACGQTASVSQTITVLPAQQTSCVTPQNLSLSGTATQSSTQHNAPASRARDGNTNGNMWVTNSVSHTNWENNPWWQIDLGATANIHNIRIWNRTDANMHHLSNYYILVSNQPFNSNNLSTLLANPAVTAFYHAEQAGYPTIRQVNLQGRYVRIQHASSNFLALAEVEVMGCPVLSNLVAPNSDVFIQSDTGESIRAVRHLPDVGGGAMLRGSLFARPLLLSGLPPQAAPLHSATAAPAQNHDLSWTIRPNPASTTAYILNETETDNAAPPMLFNSLGHHIPVVFTPDQTNNSWQLNVSELSGGLYYVRMYVNGRIETRPLLVAH